jgi:hypothetical protein
MEIAKKTTILFPPDLSQHLAALARDRHSSVTELVRSACLAQYRLTDRRKPLSAVAELAGMAIPVDPVRQMER